MDTMDPTISVLLPVRNGADFIEECLESVFAQTFKDFECLVINDGSTDETAVLVKKNKDIRLRSFELKPGRGVPGALNFAILQTRGKYLARVDADDILHPQRFEKQVRYMEEHPEIGVLGSWAACFGSNKHLIQPPADHAGIVQKLLFDTALFHPTVLIRRSIFEKQPCFYNEKYPYTEDVELWLRLAHKTRFANLQEHLVRRRLHRGMSTYRNKKKMQYLIFKLRKKLVTEFVQDERLGRDILEQMDRVFANNFQGTFRGVAEWLDHLERAAVPSRLWSLDQVRSKMALWRRDAVVSLHLLKLEYTPRHFLKYLFDSGQPWRYVSLKQTAAFFVKCMVFWKARPYI